MTRENSSRPGPPEGELRYADKLIKEERVISFSTKSGKFLGVRLLDTELSEAKPYLGRALSQKLYAHVTGEDESFYSILTREIYGRTDSDVLIFQAGGVQTVEQATTAEIDLEESATIIGPMEVLKTAARQSTRNEHYQTERNLRAFGLLNYFFAALSLITAIPLTGIVISSPDSTNAPMLVGGIVCWVLALLCFVIGRGLRNLQPSVRTPALLLSAVGLLGFPVGTALSAYLIALLTRSSGKFVLSEEYQKLCELTEAPRLQTRTRTWVWVWVGIFVAIGLINIAIWLAA